MLKFTDWCYHKLPSTHKFWIGVWVIWFITLWYLSSCSPDSTNKPKIPHLDKVAHFCYFMAGGFCFANFLHIKKSITWRWKKIILVTFLAGAIVGAIDEYHQTKTPGRTGNDPADWSADLLGTLAGAYYCYFMWARFRKSSLITIQS